MPSDHIVEQITDFLSFRPSADARIREVDARRESRHERRLVRVVSDETDIPAYLFVPDGDGPFPAAVVFHQHAGERHIGKSEVAGLAGDPLQAFGPRLAALGFVVLAPDSIAFEDDASVGQGSRLTKKPTGSSTSMRWPTGSFREECS